MANVTVQHVYSATQADGSHVGMLQPSGWNQTHLVTIDGVVGTQFSGTNINGTLNSNGMSLSVVPGGGAGDGFNIIAAGGSTANSTGTINFANSNGFSFGLNGTNVTASYDTSSLAPVYHAHQAGIEGEPVVTDNGNGTINVASEDVWFFTDATRETLAFHTIAAATNLAPGSSDTSYLVADRDTNTWVLLTDYSLIDNNRYIPYLIVYKGASNNLHFQKEPLEAHGEVENHRQRVANCERYGRESGFDQISVAATTRLITTNAGVFWAVNRRYSLNAVTSASTRWFLNYHLGGVWTSTTGATNATINNTQYDDGTDIQTLAAGEVVINYLYRGVEDQDHLYIVLSNKYNSITEAKASGIIGTLPELVTSHAVLIGRVIVEQGQDVQPTDIESAFTETFAASTPVTVHNDLAGLQGGSSTNYYHVSPQIYSNLTGSSYVTGGFTGVNATGTLNSNGLSLSVAAPGGGGGAAIQGSGTYSQNTGTVQFQNGNGVTFGLSNDGVMTASVAAVGGAQTGISSMGNSQTTYTSGQVQFVGSNIITVQSTTGQGFVINAPAQTDLTNHAHAYSNATTAVSSRMLHWVAGTVTSSGSVVFSGSGGISVVGNANTVVVSFDGHHMDGVLPSGNGNGTGFSSMTSGTLGLNFMGAISASQNGNSLSISAPAQSVQTQNSIQINGGSGAFTLAGTSSGSQSTVGSDIVMTHNSLGLNLGVPKWLTTYAQSVQTQNSVLINGGSGAFTLAGTSTGSQSTVGSDIVLTHNSLGLNLGVPKYLTTAALSGDSTAYQTSVLSNTFFPSSQTTKFAGSGFSTASVAGSDIAGTVNSNGVSLGIPKWLTAAAGGVDGYNSAQFTNSTANSTMPLVWAGNSNGSGNVTMGLTGSTITMSAPAGGGAADGWNPIAAGGSTGNSTQSIVFGNANGVSFSLNGSTITASHNGVTTAAQSNQVVNSFNGSTGQISFVTGSGMSTTTNASTITFGLRSDISTAWSGQTTANQSRVIGIAGSAASTASGNVQFANSNGLTFGLSANSVMTASHNGITSQSVQTQNSVQINGGSGAFTLAGTSTGATNASVTLNSNGINISVAAPGAAAENNWINLLGANTSGNTTVSGSTIGMSGVNLTLSGTNVSQMVISAPAVSVLSALTNITIGTTGSTIGFSVADPGGGGGAALQGSGTYTQNSGTVQFANSNGVTFGLSANGVMTASAAGGGVAISAGGSNFTNGTVSFGNQGLFSFSTSNGSVIGSYSDPDGWSINGNTAGASNTLALSNGTFYLSGGPNITLSNNGSTLVISGPAAGGTVAFSTLDKWYNPQWALASLSSSGQTNASYSINQMLLPCPIQFSRVDVLVSMAVGSSGASNVAACRFSNIMVLYTKNGSTLNPVVGVSNTQVFSWASNTGSYSSVTGPRLLSFALGTTLPPDEYWIGLGISSTSAVSSGTANTTALNATMSMMLNSVYTNATGFADFNAVSAGSTNMIIAGCISSQPTATNQTIQLSQLTMNGATYGRAMLPMRFRNS